MPKAFATLVDEIELELQDSTNVLWTAAELGTQLEDALREISNLAPNIVREIYEFETRAGRASATTAGALVDATESQFLSTDVDKVIYNTTDRTWAVVEAFVSTSQLTLTRDIMAINENYKMFNRDCWNIRQLYIGDVEDYVGDNHGVVAVEYKTLQIARNYRSFQVEGNVLTVGFDGSIPDSKTANADIEVFVWFNRRHQVSQLTDLAGAVNLVAGYARGATTIAVDGLAGAEVIAEDQEFIVAGLRGVYRTTAATTLAAGAGSITFFPPLDNALADDDVVTFLGSSLSRDQERIVVDLAAGRAAESKATRLLREANSAITSVASAATALALSAAKILRQVTDVASGRTAANLVATLITTARTELDLVNPEVDIAKVSVASAETAADLMAAVILEANTEIDRMKARVDTAISTLDSARGIINTVTKGGPNVPGHYAGQASEELETAKTFLETAKGYLGQVAADNEEARMRAKELAEGSLGTARGYLGSAGGYLDQAVANESSARNFLDLGKGELEGAAGSASEALAYLEKAASELAVVDRVAAFRAWGRDKADRALQDVVRGRPPRQVRRYSRA